MAKRTPDPTPISDSPSSPDDLALTYGVTTATSQFQAALGAEDHELLQHTFVPGRVLQERYQLVQELGRGGMGQVFFGRDLRLDRPVAIKVIRSRLTPQVRDRAFDAQLHRAFAEEARLGANLTHPAIATVYDFGFHEGNPFTVFEYIPGETLRVLLRRRGRLPLEEVRLILGLLAQALDFAHARHVVHRDLKPENIRATEQGLFKILDLGLAKEFNRPTDWRFAGTPVYASPEQISGLPSDGRTDQYALALIVYELLTGRRVFESRDCTELFEMHLRHEPHSPKALVPELPDSICAAILQSLRKDPNGRFATCEALAVGVGCQLLNTPSAVQHILQTAMFRRMSGDWPAGKGGRINRRLFRFAYARVAVTADALWICRGDDIVRLPIQAIEEIRADPYAIKLRLTIRTLSRVSRTVLYFGGSHELKAWEGIVSDIVKRKGQMPTTNPADLEEFRVKGVVLLAQRPQVRYQLLGAVEAEDQKRWRAELGLRLKAAIMGADAVVEVKDEKLPQHHHTMRRLSGTAVQAVDETGQNELRSRWFERQVASISIWTIAFVTVGCAGRMTYVFRDNVPSIHSILLGHFLPIVLIHVWPLILAISLRLLLWPQLLRPTAFAIVALGTAPAVLLLGEFSSVALTGKWGADGVVQMIGTLTDPLSLALFLGSLFVAGRAWKSHREFRALLSDQASRTSSARTWFGGLATVVSIAYGITLAYLFWG